ncbi:hypothetical protein RUM44_013448 [Polyplax serrata]|uniref:Uncharacterized protein n=1 Tax=Polyplax serrata TaxID=468196 RepID=A0ABR1BE69_POLSC
MREMSDEKTHSKQMNKTKWTSISRKERGSLEETAVQWKYVEYSRQIRKGKHLVKGALRAHLFDLIKSQNGWKVRLAKNFPVNISSFAQFRERSWRGRVGICQTSERETTNLVFNVRGRKKRRFEKVRRNGDEVRCWDFGPEQKEKDFGFGG